VQAPNPPLEGENIFNIRKCINTCIDPEQRIHHLHLGMYTSQSYIIHI
jgi:hypothetical protein